MLAAINMSNTATVRWRKGVVWASITQLTNISKDVGRPTTLELAHGMTRKLDSLELRTNHHVHIDMIDDDRKSTDEHNDSFAIPANHAVRSAAL